MFLSGSDCHRLGLVCFFFSFLDIFFNTSLLQIYIYGALEDMRHW